MPIALLGRDVIIFICSVQDTMCEIDEDIGHLCMISSVAIGGDWRRWRKMLRGGLPLPSRRSPFVFFVAQ